MKDEVRMALRKFYHFYRKDLMFRRDTKFCWMPDSMMLRLENVTPKKLNSAEVTKFCNKPTFLYWAHAAQIGDTCPGLIFGCIYKSWLRYYNDELNIEFGHFFASPVRITSTGPTSVLGVLKAHKSLCEQVSSTLRKVGQSEPGYTYPPPWPKPQYYKLLPLCRAVIVLLDKLGPEPDLDSDGFINLDVCLQQQTVLLIRTGDESGLSAPITFESIIAQSLPLARCDITGNFDAVRVSLATAVGFIANLMQREEAAFPNSRDPSSIDPALCPPTEHYSDEALSAEAWVDTIMQEADSKGIDNVLQTSDAVRQVKATKRGEFIPACRFTPYHFDSRWK